ncbi:cytochrome c peroxidase [Spirosoma validum]|uniref:Cytochrome-c peroxidase n=1 Tax=Spirosoma validum TaxID=2771355 RepID=A0A927B5S3_9BACT|nr:cytochrome c peroxidase [Spirosoma validum]MBD2755808.1 cytochrome-c peroxidase [Spirosoma validum]
MKATASRYWLALMLASGLQLLLMSSFKKAAPLITPAQRTQEQFLRDIIDLDSVASRLETAIKARQSASILQLALGKTRDQYKRIEYLTEYYYPLLAKAINGPAVVEGELDDGVGLQREPSGLQLLEEKLIAYDSTQNADLLGQVSQLRQTIGKLSRLAQYSPLSDEQVFDAMRLEVFRLIALGISGFDTPISRRALPEAAIVLSSLEKSLAHYRPRLQQADPGLTNQLQQALQEAISALRTCRSFDDFDRLHFIRNHAYKFTRLLTKAQQVLIISIPVDRTRLLSASTTTLSEPDAFDPGFFTNTEASRSTAARVALGRQLFYEPILSGNGQRTCATCHRPDRAFTDGETTSLALDGHERIHRNTPTLLNAALQTAQFMDLRAFGLEDQIRDVLQNKTEMGGSLARAVEQLNSHDTYPICFKEAYTDGITAYNITNALANYVRSLTALDSRVDRYLRGLPAHLTTNEKRGFNLFMGKANCGTCHYFPLFNGSIPPAYQKTESEVIGAPATASERQVDSDSGRYLSTKLAIHQRAFKIPTVRHAVHTAPYMHNGVYQTLEQVVEFYDKGGGRGLGFAISNQTLPANKLNLTPGEKKALVAFMKAL